MMAKEKAGNEFLDDSEIDCIVIEPYYGGSHKQFIDTLETIFSLNRHGLTLYTLTPKKWHWKARTSALQIYKSITVPYNKQATKLFCSSVLNLAELLALRPDLSYLTKILYFHENQLQYPVRKSLERDFQYGYNQILSCLVADVILFNSKYNLNSFMSEIPHFLNQIPDYKPDSQALTESLRAKASVLYYPLPKCIALTADNAKEYQKLHIVWPHRWEHDKDPETFFSVLINLSTEGYHFDLSVLGEQFTDNPKIFEEAKVKLSNHIFNWGYKDSKDEYHKVLASCHVVVSTAKHEFFGVSMLEAVLAGCYPIAPNKLVYPEHFPDCFYLITNFLPTHDNSIEIHSLTVEECLYNTTAQLSKKLRYFCRYPDKTKYLKIDLANKTWDVLRPQYENIFIRSTKIS